MAASTHSAVEMHFADGTVFNAWESFTIKESFTDPLGSYDFTVKPTRANLKLYSDSLRKGELVGIVINQVPQAAPIITEVKRTVGRDSVVFNVSCQSVLTTAYQGSVDPDIAKHYQSDTPVTTVVLEALFPYGFSVITGDSAANRGAMSGKALAGGSTPINVDSIKHKDAQAQEGETAYGFCARIFSRFGVALRVDAGGQLLLEAPDYEQEASYTIVQDFDGKRSGDRFLDGVEVVDSNDDQFSEVIVRGAATDSVGQTRANQPKDSITAVALNTLRPQYQSTVAFHKPRIIKDKVSRDAKRCGSVAKLCLGMRAPKAFYVMGSTNGFVSQTGRIWTVGTICRVVVEACGIDEDMYLLERTLTSSRDEGQKATMKFLPKNALVLGDSVS